jgi:DnaJ like chaperone protein
MGLDDDAWDRAWRGSPGRRFAADAMEDAYAVLGVPPDASAETIRARWRALARDHHPDTLAARGVPAEIAAKATEQAARINAAWDRIKRGRGL